MHFAEDLADFVGVKSDWNFSDFEIEKDFLSFIGGGFVRRGLQIAQHRGRTECGMPAEWNFLFWSENPDFDALFAFDGRIARENESGFLKIGFAGNGLHFVIGEAASVRENGERIAFKTARSENVDLDEGVFAFAR